MRGRPCSVAQSSSTHTSVTVLPDLCMPANAIAQPVPTGKKSTAKKVVAATCQLAATAARDITDKTPR